MSVKAFSLFGTVELKNTASAELHKVDKDVDHTGKKLGSLKGALSGALHIPSGALSGVNSAIGTLGSLSETIQAVPVIGRMIGSAVSTVAGPIKDLAQLGLGFNDLKENATIAFSVILKDGEKAKKLFDDLAAYGKTSPVFKTADLIGDAQLFLQELGPGKELFETMKGIAAITAATGHLENMDRNMQTFKQVMNKPKLSAEEMTQQFPEAFVDAWGLLARARGQTVGEVQALVTAGKLSGTGSAKVIVQQGLREYGSIVDLMGQTRTGKQAQIDDTVEQLAAKGTENLHRNWKEGQDLTLAGLSGPQGVALAGQINALTGQVGDQAMGALKSLLDGSLLTKAQEVMAGIQDKIKGAGKEGYAAMAGYAGMVEQGWRDVWEQNSPSAKAERLGQGVGDSFEFGLLGSLTRAQKEIAKRIVEIGKIMGVDEKLIKAAVAAGWVESRFRNLKGGDRDSAGLMQQRPSIKNKDGSPYWGTYEQVTNPDYAIKRFYKDAEAKDKGESAGKLAQKVQGSAYPKRYEQAMPLANQVISTFSANGLPFSIGNPMPVTVVGQVIAAASAAQSIAAANGATGSLASGANVINTAGQVNTLAEVVKIAQDAQTLANDPKAREAVKAADEVVKFTDSVVKATPALQKLGETSQLTAAQIEENKKQSDLDDKDAQKKGRRANKLIDPVFTTEGVAGDFHGGLQSLLAGLGHDKPLSLGKQFLFGLLQDVQGRLANDMSTMITDSLFGGLDQTSGKRAGGLFGGKGGFDLSKIFSSLFGGLFGGHRASGGGMTAGRMYVAGEHGQELIMMGQNGYAYNARETRGMMSGRGEERITFALGDRAVAEAIEAHRTTHRSRRSRLIEGKWMRKLQSVSYS